MSGKEEGGGFVVRLFYIWIFRYVISFSSSARASTKGRLSPRSICLDLGVKGSKRAGI